MKKRNLILAGILAGTLGVAGISGAAYACGGPGGDSRGDRHSQYRGEHRGDQMKHMMKKLDLSQEQREAIRTIKNESREQMQAKRDEMFEIRKALKKQASAKTFDAAKVRELAEAKSKIMADMTVQRIENMHEIRKQLTPEQLEKFDAMKNKRSKRNNA